MATDDIFGSSDARRKLAGVGNLLNIQPTRDAIGTFSEDEIRKELEAASVRVSYLLALRLLAIPHGIFLIPFLRRLFS